MRLVFTLVILFWFIVGLFNLFSENISKFQYGMLWTSALAYMLILLSIMYR